MREQALDAVKYIARWALRNPLRTSPWSETFGRGEPLKRGLTRYGAGNPSDLAMPVTKLFTGRLFCVRFLPMHGSTGFSILRQRNMQDPRK